MTKDKQDILKDLQAILQSIQQHLRKIYRGENSHIAIIHGSSQLAQETLFQNLFYPRDTILVIGNESSASALEHIAKLSQLNTISVPANEEIPLEEIKEKLIEYPHTKAILLPLVEESTGVLYKLQTLSTYLKQKNILLIVNISDTLLMNPFYFTDNHIDAAISTLINPIKKSQFSFIALSPKAYDQLLDPPRHFLSLKHLVHITEECDERELYALDAYKEVLELLHLITYYEMWQWNHYFGALTTYLRNSIRQLGYYIIPSHNYSNSHILIKLPTSQNAYLLRSKVYEISQLIIEVLDEHTLLINMNRYMHIFDTLKLIDALSKTQKYYSQ
ncbi:MAG: aminotransferase class V-fold PLP-dependent enzyme [Erysipelotrichaceae bacterium]|nr:aminotransferase class V-fold PLP-dependent enzyme [Erysipelotrichaceae bacterium]